MTNFASVGAIVTLVIAATACKAQDGPPKTEPSKEREWLKQFEGEWHGDVGEVVWRTRTLGDLWTVFDIKGTMGGIPMTAMMTLGYDAQKKKYVGTWADSVFPHLWILEGTVDASGKILPLETEGPNPAGGGKMTKMKDTIELKSKDHFVLTSSMRGDDGKWNDFMTVNYRRKK
jgi:hypothetical protein